MLSRRTVMRWAAAGSSSFAPRAGATAGCALLVASRPITSDFMRRHIGPTPTQATSMLKEIGYSSFEDMFKDIVPHNILRPPMADFPAKTEAEALAHLRSLMSRNKVLKSCIGQGYYEAIVPPVILRNVLENPAWYTPYTPYQAEVSQGRLESLLNYQTVITELTKMDVANASLLDEATAAAEAMTLAVGAHKKNRRKVFVASNLFRSSIEMIRTRAGPLGIEVVVGPATEAPIHDPQLAAVIVQTPDATGALHDYSDLFAKTRVAGVVGCCATDLLAATKTKSAGEMGADVAFGSSQRLGVPLGYGGPYAAFFAVTNAYTRVLPGRVIGVSKDASGKRAIRMALQTREQHIRREKATSNICTAQALLANMAAMYCVFHGPEGLKNIASNIHESAKTLAIGIQSAGHKLRSESFFDTITVDLQNLSAKDYAAQCTERGVNVHVVDRQTVSIAVDEATREEHLSVLLECAGLQSPSMSTLRDFAGKMTAIPDNLHRTSTFLPQPVFHNNHSETALMRYAAKLARRDYGLTHGMVPLGSCTMKLNPAASMIPMSWPELNNIHPYAPEDQTKGYSAMFVDLIERLKAITGFSACSLQPNSGAQGEYAGLRTIRAYHESRGEGHRNICFIPISAHGTNPASAVIAGLNIVTIACTPEGKINFEDLKLRIAEHGKNLAMMLVTYPSTYGVFDSDIATMCQLVHDVGGQVYIDGANLNAMVGWTGPAFLGGDVCHINMHKTFSIPHGGGGPGMGPICVRDHLAPFLPNSTFGPQVGGSKSFGQVSQAPYGSASILNISYMEMIMLGTTGLKACTSYAVLNANYLMKRLEGHYKILFRGDSGHCAHEFIIDLRGFKASAGLEAEDIAKRLMDYGFHAPTLAFPVPGTLMVEPTESEPLEELDRFIEAMVTIREEIREIETGKASKTNNVLKNSPHSAEAVLGDTWDRPYSREKAAFPTKHQRDEKFWPFVGRIDGAYGDRNLMCSCSS